MEANANKCHFLVSTEEKLKANIPNYIVTNSDKEKLLGVTIGNLLKFATCSSRRLYKTYIQHAALVDCTKHIFNMQPPSIVQNIYSTCSPCRLYKTYIQHATPVDCTKHIFNMQPPSIVQNIYSTCRFSLRLFNFIFLY